MVTFTVDKYGRPGMPTYNVKKIRKLLKSGKAEIFCYHPFTIKLLYADELKVQPVEICLDTGDKHIGVSVKSEKHEFVHTQYDPLPDEKKRHDDRRRYRRTRRNTVRDTGNHVSTTGAKRRAGSLRQWNIRKTSTSVS